MGKLRQLVLTWKRELRMLADELGCRSWGHTLGKCTAFDGHSLGVEAALGNGQRLALEIELSEVHSRRPVLQKARLVLLGESYPEGDRDFRPSGEPLPRRRVARLERHLARLRRVFARAVRRGDYTENPSVALMGYSGPPSGPPPIHAATTEEVAVYQAALAYTFGSSRAATLVLAPLTLWEGGGAREGEELAEFCAHFQRALPGVRLDTLQAALRPRRVKLDDRLGVPGKRTVFKECQWWQLRELYREYPDCQGATVLTPVGISRDQALLLVLNHTGAQEGRCLVLERRGQDWEVVTDADPSKFEPFEGSTDLMESRTLSHLEQLGCTAVSLEADRARLRLPDGRPLVVVNESWFRKGLAKSGFLVTPAPVTLASFVTGQLLADLVESS